MCSGCFGNLVWSIILGAILGILLANGVVTFLAPVFFGLILVLSVLFLVLFISTLITPNDDDGKCFCKGVTCLVWVFGVAIVTSLLAVAITLVATLPLVGLGIYAFIASSAFLVGLLGFLDLIICTARKRCCN